MALLLVLVSLFGLSIVASPALALDTHVFSLAFGSTGAGAGQVSLAANSGVAVNATTHDVYVADAGNNRIDQFSAAGVFIRAWGWGVADGLPGFETCTLTCQQGAAGSGAGQLSAPAFIAVDNSGGPSAGDVYVGDAGSNTVSKFSAAGGFISTNDGSSAGAPVVGPFGALAGVTVDGSGDLWVYDQRGSMFEFAQAGGFITDWYSGRGVTPNGIDVDAAGNLYVLTGGGNLKQFTATGTDVGPVNGDASDPTGVAVDRSNSEVYMDSGGVLIRHYPSSCDAGGNCSAADTFGSGHLSGAAGLAIDPSSDSVYAASVSAGEIEVFTGPVILPDVSGSAPSSLHGTTVTLEGHIDPAGGGNVTTCRFEYGTDTTYGQTAPCSPAGPYSTPADVSADVSGLSPNTTYHFRLDAGDAQGENQTDDQTFTTLGPIIDGVSTAGVSASGVSLQAQVNPNGQETTYHFEYVDDASFQSTGFTGATSVPVPDGDLGAGPGDQPVQQDLTGLQLATDYHYRVIASNSDATVTSAPQTFTTLPAVQIDASSAREVTSTSATLDAQVNPDGITSTYHFQYVSGASFQASGYSTATSIPTPPGDLGSGVGDVTVSQHIQGLAPSTTYHYRAIASNLLASTGVSSPDHTFTTQTAGGGSLVLPDGRGYELVTPAVKGDGALFGAQLGATLGGFQASISGDKLAYRSITPFPGSPLGSGVDYLGSRGSGGWSSQALDPPQATATGIAQGPSIGGYSLDLSKAVLIDGGGNQGLDSGGTTSGQDVPPLVSGEPAHNKNVFLRDNLGSSYQLMNLTPSGVVPYGAGFENASADFSHVIFHSKAQLTAGALPGVFNLYQWFGGAVSLVGQVPTPPATVCGAGAAPCSASVQGAALGAASDANQPGALGAVSSDGSKDFFQEPQLSVGSHHLYVREDGNRTVEYSASQKTNGAGPGGMDPSGPRPALYWTASSDGSKAFFSSCEQLTNDSTATTRLVSSDCTGHVSSSLSGQDLYQYDTGSGALTDLTVDHNSNPDGADVQGVLGVSADGSYVYFVANGVLASGASTGNCTAGQAGSDANPDAVCGLYVVHGGVTRFIAMLSGRDFSDWNGTFTGRVTPDGTHLVFDSARSLTGYDNGPGLSSEVYLYSADTGRIVCASCDPSGARPVGPASIGVAPVNLYPYLPRNLSADGRRLFFDSQDALVPGDRNGKQDVYEYEDGSPHLISSGTSNTDSAFVDASASGDDVFFKTSEPLVGQDVDQSLDIYDARVGGGFPFSPPGGSCVGDACRPTGSGALSGLSAGSVTFVGPGDTVAPALSVGGGGVRVLAKGGGGSRLTLRVSVPSGGRVSVMGSGIRRLSKRLERAGVYRVVLTLTPAERQALRRKHSVRLRVRVGFVAAGGRASAMTVSITDKA